MCGFVGYFTNKRTNDALIYEMGKKIEHRGPDSFGIWKDIDINFQVCHRRLSILELSLHGAQPMTSINDKYILAFNGEIYNYKEVRKLLDQNNFDIIWNGNSDTEVLLNSIIYFGLDKTLNLIAGMFSFSLWDSENKELFLVRDRIGEKPLYYGWQNNTFFFTSELKALYSHTDFNKSINLQSVGTYFKYGYITSEESIYQGIYKIKPGTYLKIDFKNNAQVSKSYWELKNYIDVKNSKIIQKDKIEVIKDFNELLNKSIVDQMISDVPLGAFLSGGIDSSLVVAIMQNNSKIPIKTFTIGFENASYNEAHYAKKIAQYLKTDHTELYLSSADLVNNISFISKVYDEPFSDSSQIPTFLVSKLAKSKVTVSLSGDGGDELFAGYNRYTQVYKLWNIISFLPLNTRILISKLISSFSPKQFDFFNKWLIKFLPQKYKYNNIGDQILKVAKILSSKSEFEIYDNLVSINTSNNILNFNFTPISNFDNDIQDIDFIHKMMYTDTLNYLPNDILVKVDRAAMANSLETRVPFLDHRIVEFAWSLPLQYKINDSSGKWILRKILEKHIPNEFIERPKMGFGIPLGELLRGPLKEWANSLITRENFNKHNLLKFDYVKHLWNEHTTGKRNLQHQIWSILIFQDWYNNSLIND